MFADRYHARPLRTPREVRNALVYVLHNARKHGVWASRGADPFSSGETFEGWKEECNGGATGLLGRARTWLLRAGWKRHGFVSLSELPATA